MKSGKRVTAFLLAIILLVSNIPFSSYANEAGESGSTEGSAQVQTTDPVSREPAAQEPEETKAQETEPQETADVTYTVSRYLEVEQEAAEGEEPTYAYNLIDTITVTGEPGAEVILPAVPGAVAVNTDAEDTSPRGCPSPWRR